MGTTGSFLAYAAISAKRGLTTDRIWQEVVLLFRWADGRNGDHYLFHSVLPVSLPFRTTRVDLRNTLLAHHGDSTDHGDH